MNEVSLFRLYLLRGLYLFVVLGLSIVLAAHRCVPLWTSGQMDDVDGHILFVGRDFSFRYSLALYVCQLREEARKSRAEEERKSIISLRFLSC
jgi:hypothetical protein